MDERLEAGRELDALIAEKVMGIPSYLIVLEGTHQPPHYSTDISAAWQVVEKLRESFEEIGIHWIAREQEWSVEIYYLDDEGRVGHAHAPTAPLAICRAALKAVGYEP